MLKGEFQYALDDKGRVVIPPRFRRVLGDQVVATRSIDRAISIYSPTEWTRVEDGLRRLSINKRELVHYMLAGAVDLDLDRQGRVTLPVHLRQHADIDRDVVVVGLITRLEVWSKAIWQSHIEKIQKSAPELAEQLEELRL
jgi:MraZ protein